MTTRRPGLAAWVLAVGLWLPWAGMAAEPTPEQRGEVVLYAAGGCGCHTDYERDGEFLAGGKPIKTPFGTFFGTNITPDDDTGIGKWTEADFVRAMREGRRPEGGHFFPVFPYTSFTRMTDGDLRDLWAYLRAVPAVRRPNTPHDVLPPFGWRIGLIPWKWMFFSNERFQPRADQDAEWNRGAYLVEAVGHCAECHTPRTLPGSLKSGMHLAGSLDGPEGQLAPNITPEIQTGIGDWSQADISWYLETGQDADGDQAERLMAEVIEHGFGKLPKADLKAIAVYLKTIPPIHNQLQKKKE